MGISELIQRSPKDSKDELPITPQKECVSIDSDELPGTNESSSETVRRRRGYRPLSVFTPSVFFPFDGETAKAMALLDQPESEHPSSSPPGSLNALSARATTLSNLLGIESPTALAEPLKQSVNAVSVLQQDEAPAPKSEIKCSYSALMFLPPPDPSQHPAFQADPFTSVSDSPDLICTSTAEEIRKLSLASQDSRGSSFETCTTPSFGGSIGAGNRTSDSSESNSSVGKRKIYIPDYIRSPDPILGKKGFSARMEGSPLANRFCEIVIAESSTSLPDVSEGDKRRVGSGSLRKLSEIFKAKLSGERSLSSSSSTLEASEEINPRLIQPRSILEDKLRATTYSPNYRYQSNSAFPRHPVTGRNWKSRNLKCTTCFEQCCDQCGRACCAFRAAVMELESQKDDLQTRAEALQRIQEITMVYPCGKEAPTFLRCSADSDIGCGRMLCPDCCGQCPEPWCKDIQCYHCKRDPWSSCEWHTGVDLTLTTPDVARTYGSPVPDTNQQ